MTAFAEMLMPYRRIITMLAASIFSLVLGMLLGFVYKPVWLNLSVYSTFVTIFAFSASFLFFGRGGMLAGLILGLYLGSSSFDIVTTGAIITGMLAIFSGIWFAHMAYKDLLGIENIGGELGIGVASLFMALFTAIGIDLIYL
ncbi:MAG: hypothetical protein J4432_01875 [DPANN group archaeon]|nr:hypothetical protein [DPANN group archaeon]